MEQYFDKTFYGVREAHTDNIFIFATIGAAIGLAKVWRFLYVVGTSSGSTFVLAYIVISLLFVMPIIIAELMIGRYSKKSMIGSVRKAAVDYDSSKKW
ncbi:MAG: hypothetical protein GKR93_12545 [Gammaproteobacteria bacterium]|nr:hypothetical protein [Gammaproteobacteria bacterium]